MVWVVSKVTVNCGKTESLTLMIMEVRLFDHTGRYYDVLWKGDNAMVPRPCEIANRLHEELWGCGGQSCPHPEGRRSADSVQMSSHHILVNSIFLVITF